MPARVRLNKFLRDCLLGSRRKCERLIDEGLVKLNGQVVERIGTLIDPEIDVIEVEGKRVRPQDKRHYIVAYKPRGCLVTAEDPYERTTVYEAVRDLPRGVFAVGRLDLDSEGLLLLFNDGKLAHRLAHPRCAIGRTYRVGVKGSVGPGVIEQMREGIELEDGLAVAKAADVIGADECGSVLEIVLTEGKKREIRRMLAACGLEVIWLRRIRFGTVSLGDLAPGDWRPLTRDEIRGLRRMVEKSYLSRIKERRHEEDGNND
jgi:23S rRNA pseudouridine2605 synthase